MKSAVVIKRRQIIDRNFLKYLYPLFFTLFADSILTYAFPVIVNDELNSPLSLGLIMAASSVVGIIMDLLIPKLFTKSTWRDFLFISILLSILYPIFIHLGTQSSPTIFFLLGSIIWGIYFEFMSFSEQGYIVEEEPKSDFTSDWSIIYVLWQIGSLISPILGAFLLANSILHFSATVIAIQLIALLIYYFVLIKYRNETKRKNVRSHVNTSLKLFKEFSILRVLSSKVFPVFLVGVCGGMILATFWTIGGIYGEELAGSQEKGWVVLFVFNMAVLIGSTLLIYFPIKKKKKKISQVALFLSSLLMIPIFLLDDLWVILLFVGLLSFASSIVIPLNDAVFSDLAQRSKDYEMYIMSLSRITISLSYVIGPLFVGILGEYFIYSEVLSIIGVVILIVSLLATLITPVSIRLPIKKLQEIIKAL